MEVELTARADRHPDHPGRGQGRRRRTRRSGGAGAGAAGRLASRRRGPRHAIRRRGGHLPHPSAQPGKCRGPERPLWRPIFPPGGKYLAGSEGGRLTAAATRCNGRPGRLEAGAERDFPVKCSLGLPGGADRGPLRRPTRNWPPPARPVTRVEAMAELAAGSEGARRAGARGRRGRLRVAHPQPRHEGCPGRGGHGVFLAGDRTHRRRRRRLSHWAGSGGLQAHRVAARRRGGEVDDPARADTAGNHVFRAEVHCHRWERGW